MKKTIVLLMVVFLSSAFFSMQVKASASSPSIIQIEPSDALIARLNEIRAIEKSGMSKTDKKKLRTEVRMIKNKIKDSRRGGLYLSVGAIIIIILLLILLL